MGGAAGAPIIRFWLCGRRRVARVGAVALGVCHRTRRIIPAISLWRKADLDHLAKRPYLARMADVVARDGYGALPAAPWLRCVAGAGGWLEQPARS
jgi:hypothetical protein